jgi:hypothetical protein
MNSRSSSRLSYRNVLIAAGLAAALGGQNADGGVDGNVAAASRLTGHEGALQTDTLPTETSALGREDAVLRRVRALAR